MFSEHASGEDKGENGRAEHDGRAVAQRDVFDRIEHGQEEDAAEHSLHDGADSNPGWAEDSVGNPVTGTLAFEYAEGQKENELNKLIQMV